MFWFCLLKGKNLKDAHFPVENHDEAYSPEPLSTAGIPISGLEAIYQASHHPTHPLAFYCPVVGLISQKPARLEGYPGPEEYQLPVRLLLIAFIMINVISVSVCFNGTSRCLCMSQIRRGKISKQKGMCLFKCVWRQTKWCISLQMLSDFWSRTLRIGIEGLLFAKGC